MTLEQALARWDAMAMILAVGTNAVIGVLYVGGLLALQLLKGGRP